MDKNYYNHKKREREREREGEGERQSFQKRQEEERTKKTFKSFDSKIKIKFENIKRLILLCNKKN